MLLVVLITLLSLVQGVHATCCATCLAQPLVAAVDAVNWTACSAAQHVCCFDCAPSSFGTPTYVTTAVTFDNDGARVPSGEYLQLSWPGAVAVKYLMLRKGQPKTAQVTNMSSASTVAGSYFGLCPLFDGTIYLRAFDASGCTASLEMTVTVTPGSGSCANAIPTMPPAVTSVPCDPVRGAVTNGTCNCLQDFTGPPACLENSPWKQWGQVLTYCAGGASFITAVFGFYRLWKQRQLHQHEAAVMDQSPASSDASPLDKVKEQHRSIETPLCGPTLLPLQCKTVRDDSKASSDGSSISDIYVAGDLRFHRGMDSPERNSREFSL